MGSDLCSKLKPGGEKPAVAVDASLEVRDEALSSDRERAPSWRPWGFAAFVTLFLLTFCVPLFAMFRYAAGTELHSHTLLIPLVSAYLIRLQQRKLPTVYSSSFGWAVIPLLISLGALAVALLRTRTAGNDHHAAIAISLVAFVWAGGFLFLGKRWMTAAAFPMAFLIFMVPLPDALVDILEKASMTASAEAAAFFFNIAGVPHIRDGLIFQLPNIIIQVAQECSGIRSSWVLLITGILASHLFLRSPWRRMALVAFIIPLGILRNGFRILVIGLLCIEMGPHMLHSWVHRRGGPLFFVLSLIPLFLLLWWLRRGDDKAREKPSDDAAEIREAGESDFRRS
jgi:exosortase C (VPDSG-CTERM-specific)